MTDRLLRRTAFTAMWIAAAGIGQQREAAPKEYAKSVRFVYELTNDGRAPLRDIELRLVLPPALPRQKIDLLRVADGGEVVEDAFGNRIAVFRRKALAPGRAFVAQWFASARLSTSGRPRPGKVTPLKAADRVRFLKDQAAYRLADPRISRTAAAAIHGVDDDYDKIRRLHDLVLSKLEYVRDGRWDAAPVCLARGEGSCSEYSYLFIALCRSVGLPARWVGSTALRDARAAAYEDGVFHRWAEVWLPDRGWFPVDCSRNDGEDARGRSSNRYFGRVPWPLLVLARGDGGKESMTGWSYHASGRYKGRSGRSSRRGYWAKAVSGKAFGSLAKRFASGEPLAEPRDSGLRQAWLFLSNKGLAPAAPPPPPPPPPPGDARRDVPSDRE